jgi:hypothetical protein
MFFVSAPFLCSIKTIENHCPIQVAIKYYIFSEAINQFIDHVSFNPFLAEDCQDN